MTAKILNGKKQCIKCGEWFDNTSENFHIIRGRTCSSCKSCANKVSKEYYNNNKEKLLAYHKEYYKNYYSENRSKILAKQKEKNANLTDEERLERNAKNREWKRANNYHKTYYAKNKERVKAQHEAYRNRLGEEEVKRRQRRYNQKYAETHNKDWYKHELGKEQ